MKTNNKKLSQRLFLAAAILFIVGSFISMVLIKCSNLNKYPSMISDAYNDPQYKLTLPGQKEVILLRTGAYGIYYEYSLVSASAESYTTLPPDIQCSLLAYDTGVIINAVPDYVETNQYWSKDEGGIGVLVMSITVDEPGAYTFECGYNNGETEPEITIALGPNYVWEFFKVLRKIGLPLLGSILIGCLSFCIPFVLMIIGVALNISNKSSKEN